MQIACPACDVEYDVPDARLRPGRSVRCARCGHMWEPAIPEAPPELRLAETEQGFGAGLEDRPARASAQGGTAQPAAAPDKRLRAAWIASGVALFLLFGSALVWRGSVMTGWPASQRLYALFGMRPAAPAMPSLAASAVPPLAAPVVPPPAKTADAAPPAAHH